MNSNGKLAVSRNENTPFCITVTMIVTNMEFVKPFFAGVLELPRPMKYTQT